MATTTSSIAKMAWRMRSAPGGESVESECIQHRSQLDLKHFQDLHQYVDSLSYTCENQTASGTWLVHGQARLVRHSMFSELADVLMSSYVPVRSPYILYNSLQLFTFTNFPRFFRWFRRCCRNKHLGCAPAFDCDNDLETWVRLTACCGLWWTVRNWDQKKLDYLLLHWMNQWIVALRRQVGISPRRNGLKLSQMGSKFGSVAHLRHRAAQVLEHSAERLPASFYMRGTGENLRGSILPNSTFQNENQKSHAVCRDDTFFLNYVPWKKNSRPWKKYVQPLEKKFRVLWSSGCLVLWSSGPVVLWSSGPLVLWSSGPLVLWSCGPLVLWSCGPLVLWSCVVV